ncbi:unannotated protein [freshwater metagenome]|uniref:Unannotated protein n=1 Tax=freshwater metagenome TaxID=449393 RepID=A0A6J7GA08_9ZZZZ
MSMSGSGGTPTVSIVMPCFNSEATVVRAITSVQAQSMPDWFLTIVDDGSTDKTIASIEGHLKRGGRENITIIRLRKNVGVAEARNRGILQSTGEWIAFFDADDEMDPRHLERLLDQADADVDVVICGRTVVQGDGTESHEHSAALGVYTGARASLLAMCDKLTPFPWDRITRRHLFDAGGFPQGAVRCEDSMTNIVLLSRARKVVSIAASGIRYFVSGGSITWGRIYRLSDATVAWQYMAAHVPAHLTKGVHAPAFSCARAVVALTIGQTAMLRGGADAEPQRRQDALSAATECRAWIRVRDVMGTLAVNPRLGLAVVLFKFFPRRYAIVYRRYVARHYASS